MSDETLGAIKTQAPVMVPIDSIIPYENNPRNIPQNAIDAVAESIRLFGWQQPIVVDMHNVIVVGHTRRLAAMQMGLEVVPIIRMDLPEEKVREYRLVDNRTSEMSDWNYESLAIELREFDQSILDQFFSDVSLEVTQLEAATAPTDKELEWAQQKVDSVTEASSETLHTTTVTCPSCFYAFQVRTKSLPGIDPAVLSELSSGGAE